MNQGRGVGVGKVVREVEGAFVGSGNYRIDHGMPQLAVELDVETALIDVPPFISSKSRSFAPFPMSTLTSSG